MVEEPIERKQCDVAILSVWSSFVLINAPGEKDLHVVVRSACERLGVPLKKLEIYEDKYKNFKTGLSLDPNMMNECLTFLQIVMFSSLQIYKICNLMRRAAFIWMFNYNIATRKTKVTTDELQILIEIIDLYTEDFRCTKDELTGKFKSEVVNLTATFSELKVFLAKAQQIGSYNNTSEFIGRLLKIDEKVRSNLMASTDVVVT